MEFEAQHYAKYKQSLAADRYISHQQVQAILKQMGQRPAFALKKLGESFEGRSIHALTWGQGALKIMLWSQMHGNEPTATRAFIDLWHFLAADDAYNSLRQSLQRKLQLCFIPQLNPDGVERFSRRNAQLIDINRDARACQSPEMHIFQQQLQAFQPDWCFNLHDQRSLFSVGEKSNPATISFLAPSADESREITPTREKCMRLIAQLAALTEEQLPGHTGRYTDEFYPLAVGDNLHRQGIPCVLIESGAYATDLLRDKARELNFLCLLRAFDSIAHARWQDAETVGYHQIPANQQLRRDLIFRNCRLANQAGQHSHLDLALTRKEELKNGKIENYWLLSDVGDLKHLKGFDEQEGGLIENYKALEFEGPANFTLLGEARVEFKNGLWLV